MRIGISLSAEGPLRDLMALVTRAEELGFAFAWLYETPFLAMDPYPILGAMAAATRRIRLGICVTNPVVRPPLQTVLLTATLHAISGGRMDLGIGRGDVSAHAVGRHPASLDDVTACIRLLRRATRDGIVDLPGDAAPSREAAWLDRTPIPAWMGTYGPRGLETAGRTADGVILQFADPDLVDWARTYIRRGAQDAQRPPDQPHLMVAAPVSMDGNLEDVRWFTRLVGDDLARILPAHGCRDLPGTWLSWCRNWRGVLPPAPGGSATDAVNLLADEAGGRLAMAGAAGTQVARLRELRAAGVSSFNILLKSRRPLAEHAEMIERYARDVMSGMRRAGSDEDTRD